MCTYLAVTTTQSVLLMFTHAYRLVIHFYMVYQ